MSWDCNTYQWSWKWKLGKMAIRWIYAFDSFFFRCLHKVCQVARDNNVHVLLSVLKFPCPTCRSPVHVKYILQHNAYVNFAIQEYVNHWKKERHHVRKMFSYGINVWTFKVSWYMYAMIIIMIILKSTIKSGDKQLSLWCSIYNFAYFFLIKNICNGHD